MFALASVNLLIILGIVVLLFGTKRLTTLGSDIDRVMKGFRSAATDRHCAAPRADDRIRGRTNAAGSGTQAGPACLTSASPS